MAPIFLQQHGNPEDGEREEQERHERHAVVEGAVLPKGRDDAEGNADQDCQDGGAGDERQGLDQCEAEGLRYWLPGDVLAEVARAAEGNQALGRSAKPFEVPEGGRRVQVKELAARVHELLFVGGTAGTEFLQWISGRRCQEVHEE